ncbi:MAG: Asp-tRNA(Asn)/Glu-tRNA(Gln) amidotransferase subunit GatC [Parachlamydiales bacterium]|nr:Asp-tRNA(Asn)/Glu-tRNA(Gln) amidotransferase subunit GatC [Parachlamydiales bacterium]
MANFDHQTLEHLKKLCKIECTPEENEDILNSLSRVLNYVEQLKEVNTENTKTCRYVLRGMLKSKLRDDVVADLLPREEFLRNAPDQIGGMIRVPPVLKPSS